jgi:hypothetical protein
LIRPTLFMKTSRGPEDIIINFKNPGDLGFDVSKIGTSACATIVCANGLGPDGRRVRSCATLCGKLRAAWSCAPGSGWVTVSKTAS